MRIWRQGGRRKVRREDAPARHVATAKRVWYRVLLLGIPVAVLLTLLNGELRLLARDATLRVLVAVAQAGLIVALLHYTGLMHPGRLSLRAPLAYSSCEVRLTLLALIAVGSLIGVRAATPLGQGATLSANFGFLGFAPLIAGGMVLSVLAHPLVATYLFTVLLSGLAIVQQLPVLTASAVGMAGWGAIWAIAPMRRRTDMFWAGALLSTLLALAATSVGWARASAWLDALGNGLWGIAAGLGATALFWLGLTLVERPFRLATPMILLELASPDQPLLRQLRERAPGTYFHSQQVGQLAEAAALAIGADPLLARVAGYYHDIGKLNKPDFFIENQEGIESIHARINPTLSARIIAAHVREGVELARHHRLPTAVCDIIAQHHGTSLITYFYHQAMDGGHDPVLEQHFRYDGPKPQTREAAIVMLADTVEAASRVLGEVTPARLANFVHEMIEMRRQDGQLDECDLTFRDLKLIEDAFVRVLVATRHRRIEYLGGAKPEQEPTYAIHP